MLSEWDFLKLNGIFRDFSSWPIGHLIAGLIAGLITALIAHLIAGLIARLLGMARAETTGFHRAWIRF